MTTPNSSTNTPSAAESAVTYINEQLTATQRRLRTTRWTTSIIVLAVAGYGIGITTWLHYNVLAPAAAADIATARVVDIVQQVGPPLADQVTREVPAAFATLPDMLLDQMPRFRAQLEDQVEKTMAGYAVEFEPEVDAFLTEFTNENHDRLKLVLDATNDPKLTKKFGDELEAELLTYLHAPNSRGESAMELLDQGRLALENVEVRLHRLAYAKDLTGEELKLRRVIAATMKAASIE